MKRSYEQIILIFLTIVTYYIYMYLFTNSIVEFNTNTNRITYLLTALSLLGFVSIIFAFFISTYMLGIYFGIKLSIVSYFNEIYKALYFELVFYIFSVIILLLNFDEISRFENKSDLENFSQLKVVNLSHYIFNTTMFIYSIDIIKNVFQLSIYKSIIVVIIPLSLYFFFKLI
jgi:hypothetical protein